MVVVFLFAVVVAVAEIDVVEGEDVAAAVLVEFVADFLEFDVPAGDFFALAVYFVEPTVEIVGGLYGVVTGDAPAGAQEGFVGGDIGWNGEAVVAEVVFDDAGLNGGTADIAAGEFELADFGGDSTIFADLVVVGDWYGDGGGKLGALYAPVGGNTGVVLDDGGADASDD